MSTFDFQKKIFLLSTLVLSIGHIVNAQDNFEFDNAVLESLGFENIDLSGFAGRNGFNGSNASGQYLIQFKVNDNLVLSDQLVTFHQNGGESQLCVTPELAMKIPLRYSYIKKLMANSPNRRSGEACLDLESLDSYVNLDFDSASQIVNVTLPQAFIEDRDTSWTPPEFRDNGIAGLIFDYNLLWNFQRYKKYEGGKESSTDTRSYGTVGANFGRFRLRADYQYQSKGYNHFDWSRIYAYTDIPEWNSKIQVGEINTHSNTFDSVRIKGASLYSDERMMPMYLKGYAPQITGTATTSSIVTISQYGAILKRVQVPIGPFVISDLPSYVSGTVTVEIEGSDGNLENYQVDIAQVPFLTRKGGIRYNLNIGKIDPLYADENKVDTKLVSGDLSVGVTNNISLFGGLQHTTNNEFKAYNFGVGVNLGMLGALSVDITQSKYNVDGQKKRTGQSYRFNYSKQFSSTTSLNIAGYRFSSRDYTSLINYVDLKQNMNLVNGQVTLFEKNRLSFILSQYIPSLDMSIVGSLTKGSYWNKGNMSNYDISFNKVIRKEGFFQGSSLSLTLSQNKEYDGYTDKQIGFYISIPIGQSNGGRLQYSARYSDGSKRTNQSVSYYANAFGGDYSIGSYFNHKRDLSGSIAYSLTASFNKDTGYGRLNTNIDYDDNRESLRAGFDGSLTLTKYGLATHSRAYGGDSARLILDTGSSGVESQSGRDSSNMFGLMGVSNITTYRTTTHAIDNNNLPTDVEISRGVAQVSLSDGAIGYDSLGGIRGIKSISTIALKDGGYPPFGAVVYRENGDNKEVAIVSENGLTYLTGIQKHSKFNVKWGDKNCNFTIETLDIQDLQSLVCY